MKSLLHLAWQAVAHYRLRSLLLLAAVVLTLLLPATVQILVRTFRTDLLARAASTPLLVGARGSELDLALGALYFQGGVRNELPFGETTFVRDGTRRGEAGRATPIPLHLGIEVNLRGDDAPLVGTSPEYFAFRGLTPVAGGRLPAWIGECVLGSAVAARSGLAPGDKVLTAESDLYTLTQAYPLRMAVVGVLDPSGTPDDYAVFCDVKTAWAALGLGHGHDDVTSLPETDDRVMRREGDGTMASLAVLPFQEITEANRDSFHFHGDPDTFPITAILAVPKGPKQRTLLVGDYAVRAREGKAMLVRPVAELERLLGFVLQLKRFFDANTLLVGGAMALLLGLVVLLTVRTRARELETLMRIGVSRGRVAALVGMEFFMILLGGALVALLAALVSAQVLLEALGMPST